MRLQNHDLVRRSLADTSTGDEGQDALGAPTVDVEHDPWPELADREIGERKRDQDDVTTRDRTSGPGVAYPRIGSPAVSS